MQALARCLLFPLFVVFLAGCSPSFDEVVSVATDEGVVTVVPKSQTKYFAFTNWRSAKVKVTLPPQQKFTQPVDVVLLFDRTGSMKKMIRDTAKSAQRIVGDIQSDATDIRFAVASFADYHPLFSQDPNDTPWTLELPFSQEPPVVQRAIAGINQGNGGDRPESYSRALNEAGMLAWRPQAKKLIILFGDSVDHQVDPGPDGLPGTADDLRLQEVLKQLSGNKIEVIGIYARSEPDVTNMFRTIAKFTGGQALPLEDASEAPELLKAAILESLLPTVKISALGPLQAWVKSITPYSVDAGLKRTFAVEIEHEPGVKSGKYHIPLQIEVSVRGKPYNGQVEVNAVVGWFNLPLVPFLPLLLLLALLLFLLMRARMGWLDSSYHIYGIGPPDEDSFDLRWFWVDLLFYVGLLSALVGIGLLLNGNLVLSDLFAMCSVPW